MQPVYYCVLILFHSSYLLFPQSPPRFLFSSYSRNPRKFFAFHVFQHSPATG